MQEAITSLISTAKVAGTVSYQIEPPDKVQAEASELLKLHWNEVAPYRDLCILNPDWGTYQKLTKNLCVVTARDGGKLVGYIIFIVSPHLHYKGVLVATDDVHFLDKEYRKGRVAIRMFNFAETEMRKRGVQMMVLRTKAKPDLNHGAIFEYLGYDIQDIVYTKRLDT